MLSAVRVAAPVVVRLFVPFTVLMVSALKSVRLTVPVLPASVPTLLPALVNV